MARPAIVTLSNAASENRPPVAWAIGEVERALQGKGVAIGDGGFRIEVATPGARIEAPLPLPEKEESLALFEKDGTLVAWGSDERGLVFALTEIADRIRHSQGDALFGELPLVEKPTARVRSMARLFCSEAEDKVWFYDKRQWRAYLDMLATCRFNRFALTLGMGYNYPYHNPWLTDVYFYFPYPFLLEVSGHDVRVVGLPADERDDNLEMLKFIARETARRGLEFQLALWTQRYDFDDAPRANYRLEGISDANLAPYCRDALTALLKAVPEITGVTFRVHVEGGIAEGDYAFWEHAFAGIAAVGRPIEIDMHGKGLDHTQIELARKSGMPFTCSPKYLAEHMGLPYHQSSIRNKEYPPEVPRSQREQMSEGFRKFLRYSYGDLLTHDKDYKVIYRIWAGTQRVLLWADPVLAAGYGRSSMYAGSDGVEWCEPLSFKGRMGTSLPGGRFNYKRQDLIPRWDWQKYTYQYRVWGRLLYNPDAPRDSWLRELVTDCGDAAEACETAIASASRVLPLVTLTHGPSASNNHYWPEIYTNLNLITGGTGRAYAFDMEGPCRFGNVPTFDSELFANPREYADLLLAGAPCHRYTPLDVADWLDALALTTEKAVLDARACKDLGRPAVQRLLIDAQISAGIARFFAERYRAAIWAELFVATDVTWLIEPAIDHTRRSVAAWEAIASLSEGVYQDDLTYGPQSWLRGSWHARLADIRSEILDLEACRGARKHETVQETPEVTRAVAALRARQPVRSRRLQVEAPSTLSPGASFEVTVLGQFDQPPVLHFRHVNQAERWRSLPMNRSGDLHKAAIPGDYIDSPFHLQFFVSATQDGRQLLSPGLDETLANEPYYAAHHG
jgi:hypothetical protein